MNPSPPELRRAIGLVQATAMVVGIMIGASIFVQPSEITGRVPSVPGVFAVWLVSGLLTFIGALVCAELASTFVRSGGVYIYLREAYSPAVGFLWGWAMFWSIHSGIIAAVSVIFARYASYFLPMSDISTKGLAVAAILVLSAVNYIGVKQGSAFQTLLTIGKATAILFIVVLGFGLGAGIPRHFAAGEVADHRVTGSNFLLALVAGLFAFGGWHMVTYNSEETVNPRKTIPRALMLGTLIVTACYLATNTVYMYVLPLGTVAASTRIAADVADALMGYGGGAFMSGVVMFSTLGCVSGLILCGPRVYYAMARDGLLFRWIGAVHPRFGTPHNAIILQALWSSLLVLTGTYRALFSRVVYTEWIFFALMTVGLFVLRRRKGITRDYRMWGYPVIPALFVFSSLGIVANQIISSPRESTFGLSLVLLGLPVYYLRARKAKEMRYAGH
ncbi:MAG TPA: amino acid permease [Acidobacteriota bacterium]|nr:amino acid permease [Acidobacteriota bacterium]